MTPIVEKGFIALLFFLSGFAGLVYQVLWMRELGLVFGNTSYAAATTLAAFFIGLASGGLFWGRRAERLRAPLKAYALLEVAIALSALLCFLLMDIYHLVYASLFHLFLNHHSLFVATKFFLTLSVLFPAAFFMGGTWPVMSQYLVRRPDHLGRSASLLYGVNTLGAAVGAFAAGFYLPPLLGFVKAYLLAIGLNTTVAFLAWSYGRNMVLREHSEENSKKTAPVEASYKPDLSLRAVWFLATLSGFVTLSLEVLWTRMFAQVLQNSVYTFSMILVTFLVALASGAMVASLLARRQMNPGVVLLSLILGGAFLVGLSPFLFTWITKGMGYLGAHENWGGYVLCVFAAAGIVILLPSILLGTVFPYLLKICEPFASSAGRSVGELAALNTMGAVGGALCAGFLLLDLLGLWASIRLMAAAYFLAAFFIAERYPPKKKRPIDWQPPLECSCFSLFLTPPDCPW